MNKIIEKCNQNADFTENYQNNLSMKKKLVRRGAPLAIIGFAVCLVCFVLIAIFGSDIKSIATFTPWLIVFFVLLIGFAAVFGTGLYLLRQASLLHTSKPTQSPDDKKGE